jgi:hypothetical protein
VSLTQLARIAGFGDHKATLYGVRIMRCIEVFVGRNPALRPLLRRMHQEVGGAWGWGMGVGHAPGGLQPLPQRA